MLFVLLSAGIAGLNQTQGYRAVKSSGFSADQYALQTARQSLLTYAALYPWLYGPRGAGPGHLPCPDTDAVTLAPWSPASRRDGPNPPCGSSAFATGQLPRHVNLPGQRYVFHVEPDQRLAYRVSSDMINNPVNRMVNDAVIRGGREQRPFVAWVSQPVGDAGQARSALSRVPVSRESLLPGVRRSVAAWLVARVNRVRHQACVASPEAAPAASGLQITEVLRLISDAHSKRPGKSLREPLKQDGDSCEEYVSQDTAVDARLIEGVPLHAHWFVRNGWHERVVLQSSEVCHASPSGQCILVLASPGLRADRQDERLLFIWQATS